MKIRNIWATFVVYLSLLSRQQEKKNAKKLERREEKRRRLESDPSLAAPATVVDPELAEAKREANKQVGRKASTTRGCTSTFNFFFKMPR